MRRSAERRLLPAYDNSKVETLVRGPVFGVNYKLLLTPGSVPFSVEIM